MNSNKEKLLQKAYDDYLHLMLYDFPIERINEIVADDVTGYGTTNDEKVLEIKRLIKIVADQREQGAGIEMQIKLMPVHRRTSTNEDVGIFMDEFEITMLIDGSANVIPLRLTSVFEFQENVWKLVHMHGSKAIETEGDTWHLDEWKQKTEKLERMVEEKTADLKTKNCELEIEASLERIRARTMAMHNSDELREVVAVLYNELEKLNFEIRQCVISILNDKEKYVEWWSTGFEEKVLPKSFIIPYDNKYIREFLKDFKSIVEENIKYRELELSGEKKRRVDETLFEHTDLKNLPNKVKREMMSLKKIYLADAFMKYGMIEVVGVFPVSHDKGEIIQRFANVFEQTYTRFLDLQKAEAQTRESQIEAALERVRSKAMTMQKSDDLSHAVKTIFDELDKLDLGTLRCGLGILNKENRTAEVWTTTITEGKNTVQVSGDESMDIHPLLRGAFDAWLKQKDFSYILESEDLNNYYKSLLGVNFRLPDVQSKISANDDLRQYYYVATFQAGGLFAFRETEFPEESKKVIKRFADVFNLTYTRFNDLQQAEAQNKIIKAENDRKTKELEEAHELQLAMLPKELPKLSKLDIAVYMKTATEVGGDYYDFSFRHNGSLNIAIGDATGHGMKAGTMVTMIKSLFTANSSTENINEFFVSTNKAIKKSNLKRMLISFAMLNIYGNSIDVINAGMPPVYYYKYNSGEILELGGHNLPLGAMQNSKYNADKIETNTGDVILMLSDGFPELQNNNNELYGYERLRDTFSKIGTKNAEEIISVLKNEESNWSMNKEPDDDVTFVVLKVK